MARSPWSRLIFPLLVALYLIATNCPDPAEAFHSGGVGDCDGCHSMHRADGGTAGAGTYNSTSLMASDPGSTCLKCHLRVGEKRPDSTLVATAAEQEDGFLPDDRLSQYRNCD